MSLRKHWLSPNVYYITFSVTATNTKHHTSDAQPMSSLAVHDINATEILASLPSFSFVKVQYIVFKK